MIFFCPMKKNECWGFANTLKLFYIDIERKTQRWGKSTVESPFFCGVKIAKGCPFFSIFKRSMR